MWELDHKEGWASKKWCFQTVVLEKTPESLLVSKEDQTSQPLRKSTLNIHWKDWCWSWSFNTSATRCEEPSHWKRPWSWERLMAGGEGYDRGWDLDGITNSMNMSLSKLQEIVIYREHRRAAVHGVSNSRTRLSYLTELNLQLPLSCNLKTMNFKIFIIKAIVYIYKIFIQFSCSVRKGKMYPFECRFQRMARRER